MALLHGRAFPAAERWGPEAIASQLRLSGTFGWISPTGGMVLARVVADEGEILTLAVHPRRRRQGLGRVLLSAALAEAGARGALTMYLEVSERNLAARMLYAGSGFAEVGRRPSYYAGGSAALVLQAAIASE